MKKNSTRWLIIAGVAALILIVVAFLQIPRALPYAQGDTSGLTGNWITASGNLKVEFAPCDQALCGTVVEVISNRSMSNPNVEMESVDKRPALGMKILINFVPTANGQWKGQIYNRENGKTYDSILTYKAPDQLDIRGYKLLPLFGKNQVWRRAAN